MSEETQDYSNQDPRNILCRITDVNEAVQNSFQRFLESENKSLQELADLLKNELSKMELFISQGTQQEEQ